MEYSPSTDRMYLRSIVPSVDIMECFTNALHSGQYLLKPHPKEQAKQVNLSRSYFMHLFKEETGVTVHASITQRRLLYAARLIREGMPISEAVMESGFLDYTTFYRSFRKAFGFHPSELRK